MLLVPGTPERWPFLLLLEALPAIVSLICLPFLPDPPRFLLLARNDREQARKCRCYNSYSYYRDRNYMYNLFDRTSMDLYATSNKLYVSQIQ